MCNNSNLYLALKEVIVDPASRDMSEVVEFDYQFSRRYRRIISRIMGKAESMTHRSVKMNFKIAVSLVAAVIAISAVGVSGDNEQRNWTIAKTETVDSREGAVQFDFTKGEVFGDEVPADDDLYLPEYIPDGFEINEECMYEDSGRYYYSNGDKTIIFKDLGLTASPSIDTDTHVREKITIHGYEADLFYDANDESTIILWREGYKVFEVIGQKIDKSEVINIAESVQRRK